MATVDTLVTKYQMDNRDYVRGASQVDDATMRNQRNMEGLARGIRGATTIMTGFVAGIGAATTALIALGTASVQRSAQFDAMVKALEAIEGSAKGASDAIKSLREIAARPGLGLEEAIQGYSGLRRAGLDREMSMRVLAGAGNANALAGGGREELNQILATIAKIGFQQKIQGDELNRLAEAGIAAPSFFMDKYGTMDSVQLQKLGVDASEAIATLAEGMEGLPQAATSAKNSLENFQMAWEMALVGTGQGLTTHLIGPIDEIAASLARLDENGSFREFGESLGMIVSSTFPDLFENAEGLDDVFVEMMATVLDVSDALRNFKLNLDSMFAPVKDGIAFADAMSGGLIGEIFGLNTPSSGELYKQRVRGKEIALEESNRFARERGYKDRDEMLAAREEGAGLTPEEKTGDRFATPSPEMRLLTDIERNTAMSARALNAFTLGGSAIGEDAFNSVNINRLTGGKGGGDYVDRAVNVLRQGILEEIVRNNKRVGAF